ncbi:MAG: hypothetical protein LBH96_06710 [Candidatus Peribacteria bacterium]|jgi:hypothetical protein|nr:hypothetical protein [Candidatus Peribacteria bacterium]
MIESNPHFEEEKKRKKQKQINQEKYEQTVIESKVKIEIQELKYLVEAGAVDKKLFDKITEDNHISSEEFNEVLDKIDIQKLFEKLEELEHSKDTKDLIPKELRVKKSEYLKAFQDEDTKKNVLQKFDASLDIIYNTVNGGQTMHGNMFSTYVYLLSEKLIPIQENIIDLKQPLLPQYTK